MPREESLLLLHTSYYKWEIKMAKSQKYVKSRIEGAKNSVFHLDSFKKSVLLHRFNKGN